MAFGQTRVADFYESGFFLHFLYIGYAAITHAGT
jgi:hypothetical protein